MPPQRRSDPLPIQGPAAAIAFTAILTQGPLSRVEVARRTGLSAAAITKAVRPLLDAAYLVESPERSAGTTLGRPAAPLRVWADRAFFVGVKLTGEEVIGVVVDLQAKIRTVCRRALSATDVGGVVAAIGQVVDDLLEQVSDTVDRSRVRMLGIAVSGDVDRSVGVVRYSPFLGLRDVPLAQLVESRTGLPVVLENDVRALTTAGHWFGAGVGASDLVMMTVGSGIGCGLVVADRVVSGAHGVAGEIGHLTVDPDGPMCHCGNRGCLEAVASDPAIVRRINELPGTRVTTPAEAAALAHSGHEGARAVYTKAGHAIGLGLAGVVNLFGPERVIISGEGLAAYDLFEEQVRETFAEHAFSTAAECELIVCPLPFEEWARGAAAVAIQTFISPQKN